MGKIQHPQDAESERKARGDQEKEGRPGNSTHELVEENVERHNENPNAKRNSGRMEYWNNDFSNE